MKIVSNSNKVEVDLNQISVLYNDNEEKVRLVSLTVVIMEVIQNCEYRAFFRKLFYFEKCGKLEHMVKIPVNFCGHIIEFESLLEVFMFIELFKEDYAQSLMCYEMFESIED